MNSLSPAERVRIHDYPRAHNLRDLGGLVTAGGQRVRTGRIYRSDYPAFVESHADPAGQLGIVSVVDLRRGNESEVECVDWRARGIAYRRWPLTAGREDSWHARYTSYLTGKPETVVGAVREVMRPEGHAVLFHCAAGKDRTGVVAALLLSVLGVSVEDIVADYMLSADSVEPVITRLRAMALYAEMLADSTILDQAPRPEHVALLLDWLGQQGGAQAWLLARGVPGEEFDAFRAAMLED